ncbi:hypothetical protein D5I55_00215 [Chakrabartia godavariana]|nr:hypothetical protein D5I55_00215 [Chakrabartia godavariana]
MIAWLLVFALCGLTYAALWRSGRMSRTALDLLGAALMLAVAGYAWQGSPNQPGTPVASTAR